MQAIEITVTGSQAVVTQCQPLVAGTVGLPVKFTFDPVWEGLEKTVVFRVGEQVFHQLEPETAVTVPWELLAAPGCTLWAGAFGAGEGVQLPTVWVSLGEILPGVSPNGQAESEPTQPMWQQVFGALDEKVENALDKAMPQMVAAVLAALPDGDEVSY